MGDKQEDKDKDRSRIDWNEYAGFWDDFKDARLYAQKAYEALKKHVDLEGLTILDFGCGTGILTEHMAPLVKQIVAIDTAEKMIEVLAHKNLKNVEAIAAELSQQTIDKYPELQNNFDLIVASSVCAFVPNLTEVLSLIRSLLKPKGIFVQLDWLKAEDEEGIGFTKDSLTKIYAEVGLKVDWLGVPFYFIEHEEKMDVLMAVGKPGKKDGIP